MRAFWIMLCPSRRNRLRLTIWRRDDARRFSVSLVAHPFSMRSGVTTPSVNVKVSAKIKPNRRAPRSPSIGSRPR